LGIEVRVILNRLATNVAHQSTTSAGHFVTSIFLYKLLSTLPTGSGIDKTGK
jgi:hypothetical protein